MVGCERRVDAGHFSILTPYPGTHTFARFLAEDRILSFDWSRYDLYHPVIEPARMTSEQLQDGLWEAYRWFYAGRRSGRTLVRQLAHRAPWVTASSATLAMANYARHYRRSSPPPHAARIEAAADDVLRLGQVSSVPAQQAPSLALRTARPAPANRDGGTVA